MPLPTGSLSTVACDTVFNDRVLWDAYDGPLQIDDRGNSVFDFRRIALHELGHVLGLDHPDEACDKAVDAIMNARPQPRIP